MMIVYILSGQTWMVHVCTRAHAQSAQNIKFALRSKIDGKLRHPLSLCKSLVKEFEDCRARIVSWCLLMALVQYTDTPLSSEEVKENFSFALGS